MEAASGTEAVAERVEGSRMLLLSLKRSGMSRIQTRAHTAEPTEGLAHTFHQGPLVVLEQAGSPQDSRPHIGAGKVQSSASESGVLLQRS